MNGVSAFTRMARGVNAILEHAHEAVTRLAGSAAQVGGATEEIGDASRAVSECSDEQSSGLSEATRSKRT